jgi:predicted nucleotidyltransferase
VNVSAPILDVVPGPRGLVLSALVRLSGRSTGRALAAQAGVPPATTSRILADLVESGIVEVTPAGKAMLYCLNRDHLTARSLVELAGLRFGLVTGIRDEIGAWAVAPLAAWLFGSTARGDGDRDSDIDLFFISAPNTDAGRWQEQLGGLAARVEAMTGNSVQIVEHTFESFRSLDASGSGLTKALRVDGIELVPGCWSAIAKAAA